MSKTRIKVVYNRLPEIARKLPAATGKIVEKTAHSIADDAKLSMNEQKHGEVYTRGGKKHTASAPGEAPAVDMGFLQNSIEVEMTGQTSAIVGVGAEYGAILELEEYGGAHVAPRPFMRPAAEKNQQPFIDALKRLEEELK